MKKLLPYFLAVNIISCTHSKRPEHIETDYDFIARADSICGTIDAESLFERTKNQIDADQEGRVVSHFEGYSKTASDSIDKFVANVMFSKETSGKSTYYYFNGAIIKAIVEMFTDDTLRLAYYYDGDQIIYPKYQKQPGMEEAAQKLRNQSISFRTFFPPTK